MKKYAVLVGSLLLVLGVGVVMADRAAAQTVVVGVGRPVPGVYVGGYVPYPYNVYNPRRVYRQALRYGYPPVFQVWPAPAPVVAYPYPGYGPRPVYAQPPAVPAATEEPTPTPAPQAAPSGASNSPAWPEPIPAPTAESGS